MPTPVEETVTLQPAGIPTKILIEALRNDNAIDIKDNKIALLPNGKDRVTIRVTVKDADNKLVNLSNDRKLKFQVIAQLPDINIHGGNIEVTVRNKGKKEAGDRIKEIYEGSETGKKVADEVIPIGTISESEKATQKGQADIIYTAPNLGGNQEKPAVDRVTVTLSAQKGSNETELEKFIDIQLSYSLDSIDAAKRLSRVNDGEGYKLSTVGKYAHQDTIDKIKKAGILWKVIRSRDKDVFSHIKEAKAAVDDAQKKLGESEYNYDECLELVYKALKELGEAITAHKNVKVNDEFIDGDLQIIRNEKDTDALLAIESAESDLEEGMKDMGVLEPFVYPPVPVVEPDTVGCTRLLSRLKEASDKIQLAFDNLQYASDMPEKFTITALSLRHGGIYAPHRGHRDGKNADVGLMGTDEEKKKHVPTDQRDKEDSSKKNWRGEWEDGEEKKTYDRPLTRLLITIFLNVGAKQILIQDPNIKGGKIEQKLEHYHHIHVNF